MTDSDAPPADGDSVDATTLHVRRAIDGNADSVNWIVARLTPLLLLQAERRLGPVLRRSHDPEDLVNDVWAATLPRLGAFRAEPGRFAKSLVGYLSTALFHRVDRILGQALRENRRPAQPETSAAAPLDQVAASWTSATARIVRNERRGEVWRAIASLEDMDQEILVLRGIEQRSSSAVAVTLGISVNAVDARYSRAVKRLRSALPESAFADLVDPDES